MTMRLDELRAANDLLDDRDALAARYERDGCLLVRDALDPSVLSEVTAEAAAALARSGVALPGDGVRWTGATMPHPEATRINEVPALEALVARIEDGSVPMRAAAEQVCGHPVRVWRNPFLVVAVPDDPALVTAPHQDNFAMSDAGDYRRLWFPLTEVAFGDGGLALALGSHRRGRLPLVELADFADRVAPGQTGPPRRATGVDPTLVGDHWHTASMRPGDMLVFHPDVVHRALAPTSDRIRIALATIVSGLHDPLPSGPRTGPEARARARRIRELAAPMGLSDRELAVIATDLARAGVEVDADAVRAAARGEYSRT